MSISNSFPQTRAVVQPIKRRWRDEYSKECSNDGPSHRKTSIDSNSVSGQDCLTPTSFKEGLSELKRSPGLASLGDSPESSSDCTSPIKASDECSSRDDGDERVIGREDDGKSAAQLSDKDVRKQFCATCRNHGVESKLKGHKRHCKFKDCRCNRCEVTRTRRKVMATSVAMTRNLKQDMSNNILPVTEPVRNSAIEEELLCQGKGFHGSISDVSEGIRTNSVESTGCKTPEMRSVIDLESADYVMVRRDLHKELIIKAQRLDHNEQRLEHAEHRLGRIEQIVRTFVQDSHPWPPSHPSYMRALLDLQSRLMGTLYGHMMKIP